jgi:hypothetical protein
MMMLRDLQSDAARETFRPSRETKNAQHLTSS